MEECLKHSHHIIMCRSVRTLLQTVIISLLPAVILAVECSKEKYGKKCELTCICVWENTVACHRRTGECLCLPTFTGTQCEADLDECSSPTPQCNKLFTYCQNTFGSFDCFCQNGFYKSLVGACIPCPLYKMGENCNATCNCQFHNTLFCDVSGTCICETGWTGSRCERSIDDCKGVVCPPGTVCADGHLTHSCRCPNYFLYIEGRCQGFEVDMVTPDTSPGIGELAHVILLYKMPVITYIPFHLRPDMEYHVVAEETIVRDICNAHFRGGIDDLFGEEWFLNKVKLTKEYNYYMIISFWFTEAKEIPVRVYPTKGEHDELVIVFDVRRKSPAEINCLTGLRIEHVSSTAKNAIKYKRQAYNSFEVKWNPTKECRETPKVEWSFYKITGYIINDPHFLNPCFTSRITRKENIDTLIRKAGQSAITDHRSVKEIIPKGTLFVDPHMICVRAYVNNNPRFAAGVCGFVDIVPSYSIEGHVTPNNQHLVWTNKYSLRIVADYVEADTYEILLFQWKCTYENVHRYNDIGPCFPNEPPEYFQHNYFDMPSSIFDPEHKHTVEVVVSVKRYPTITERVVITFDNYEENTYKEYIPMIIKCDVSCARVIGAKKNVILHVEFPYWEYEIVSIDVLWSVYANGSKLVSQDVSNMIGHETILDAKNIRSDSRIGTASKTLKPGVTYTFAALCNVYMKEGWHGAPPGRQYLAKAQYEFTVESPPIGDGCTISPTTGEAVFTKFTVECKNYVDTVARLPLSYKLFQLELLPYGKNKYEYKLVAYSGSSVMANITLANRGQIGVSHVKLIAEIKNVKGTASEVPLTVQLTTLDQKVTISKIGIIDVQNGGQEDAREIKNIATVISVESADVSLTDKKAVRNDLLTNMKKLDAESSDSIEHVTNVLGASVEKQGEIETSGLDSGMTTAYKLAKYIAKLGTDDLDRTKKVALTQVDALSKLLYVASVEGVDISTMNETENPAAKGMKDQNIQHSKMATTSFGNIAGVILDQITALNEPINMSNDLMDFIVALKRVDAHTSFDVESDEVKFYLPAEHSGVLRNEIVESEMEVFKKNPFGWTASNVHGNLPVVKVNLVKQSEKHAIVSESKKSTFRFSKPADVFLKYQASAEETTYSMIIKVVARNNASYIQMSSCVFMAIKVSTDKATVFHITSPDKLKIMVKAKYTNTVSYFNNLPDKDMVEMPLFMPTVTTSSKGTLYRDESLFFLPQLTKQQLKRNYPFYRMKISMKLNQTVDTAKLQRVDFKVNLSKLGYDEPGEFYNVTITATPHVMSCLHFDETTNDYLSDQCAISMYSNLGMMYCRCVVAAAFTGSVLVLPRLINPLNVGLFLEIFNNPLVVSMVIALWLIYFALIAWGRFKDEQDEKKRAVTVLDDNREDHNYVYLIGVKTGWTASSSTSSNVFIYLKGSFGQSENHVLQDPSRRLFESSAENWFMLTTQDDVGELISVVVWTDFSGAAPSWFLSSIYVINLQTNESWVCPYNNWISVYFDSAQLLAEVPAFLEKDYLTKWKLQVLNKGQNDIRNEHLWFGIFAKTSYNKFTRIRRLTTGLSLLQSLMMLNLVFFGIRDKEDPGQFIEVLDQKIHLTSVIIGIQTSFIMFWLGFGISMLFNKVSPYPKSVKASVEKSLKVEDYLQRRLVMRKLLEEESESFSDSESETVEDKRDNVKKPVDQQVRKSIIEQKRVSISKSSKSINEQKRVSVIKARKSINEEKQVSINEQTENVTKTVGQPSRKSINEQKRVSVNEQTNNIKKPVDQQPRKSINEQNSVPEQTVSKGSNSGSNKNQNSQNEASSVETGNKEEDESTSVDRTKYVLKSVANTKFKSEAKEKPANAPFMLPPWFIHVTWTLLAVYNIFLSYYIMLYGLSLGYEKSVDWVLAFFTGFLMNVFFIQPMKVAIMVLLLVLIFKQGHTIKEHAPVAKLNDGIMLVQEKKSYNRKYMTVIPKVKAPLHTAEAESVLERLAIEASARRMLRDLFLYTLFLISVLLVTYGNMNVPRQYLQTKYTQSIFLGYTILEGEKGIVSSGKLDKVKVVEDMWEYIKSVAPQMIDNRLISNTQDIYLLGTARLRQVRSQNTSTCDQLPGVMRYLFNEKSCAYTTFFGSEESNTYDGTWHIVSNISKDEIDDSPYVYRSQTVLNAAPFIGQHGFYSGGGYVITFARDDLEAMKTKIKELYDTDWIDQLTRCLFVEFTLYNPGSDHFTNVIIAFEFDNFGAIFPYASIRSANLINENRRYQTWLQLSEGFMVICAIVYTINEVQVLLKQGIQYFTNLWSVLEVATIVLTCAVGILFLLRYAELVKIMKDFQIYGNSRFFNFQVVFEMHERLQIVLAMLGAVVIFKMLKVTAFNPFVVIAFRTFANARADFFGMALITVILIFIFASTGKSFFGSKLETYMSIDRSILAILFFILEEPNYESLVSADIFFGRVYFVVVIMICQYIIVNFFCSILKEGFELTRYMAFHREQEIIKYMLRTAKLYAGFGPRNVSAARTAK